jgi:hypothetical protein
MCSSRNVKVGDKLIVGCLRFAAAGYLEAYVPTRFASLPTLSSCSLQTCLDFPLYEVWL